MFHGALKPIVILSEARDRDPGSSSKVSTGRRKDREKSRAKRVTGMRDIAMKLPARRSCFMLPFRSIVISSEARNRYVGLPSEVSIGRRGDRDKRRAKLETGALNEREISPWSSPCVQPKGAIAQHLNPIAQQNHKLAVSHTKITELPQAASSVSETTEMRSRENLLGIAL